MDGSVSTVSTSDHGGSGAGDHGDFQASASDLLQCAEPHDTSNAILFARDHADHVRYCHDTKRWFVWSGQQWVPAYSGEVRCFMMGTLHRVLQAARSIFHPLTDHFEKSLNAGRIEAGLKLAAGFPCIATTSADFDADPWLLGVANGVLDLRSRECRTGRREDMISLASPVDFDPSASCPRFERFMYEIYQGDEALIDFMQRWLGCCMTGVNSEELMVVLVGNGSNGKSLLLETVSHVFGPLAGTLPPAALDRRAQRHGLQFVAAAKGKRLLALSETPSDGELNETLTKALTSRDKLSGRLLYENLVTFTPTAKVALAVNHFPAARDTSHGMWRRLAVVPHHVQFPLDNGLRDQLIAESAGILNWLIAGCGMWQERGLKPLPPAIAAEVEHYRTSSDNMQEFLNAACTIDDGARVLRNDLWLRYRLWCKGSAIGAADRLSRNAFYSELRRRGFSESKIDGYHYFYGLR